MRYTYFVFDGPATFATGLHELGCHLLYGIEGGTREARRWCWVPPNGRPIFKESETVNDVERSRTYMGI